MEPSHKLDRRHPSNADDDENLLKELCAVNGVTYEKLALGYGVKVQKLEIFFFGCPRIPSLNYFPNLRVLCIVNQRFSRISSLEACPSLQELWICETQIQRIEGLGKCKVLTDLYLYSNEICSIEGLGSLTQLSKLWLNGNKIRVIEGLKNLSELRDLNLSGNVIKSIDHSLDSLIHLEVLRLSGNKLASLQDLVKLSVLPCLNTLSLCDPAYPPNPVCQLCNYSTHMLYHLPQLQWLDDRQVSSHELQQVVHSLVTNKKLYYRMRLHQARVACIQECKCLEEKQVSVCEAAFANMKNIAQHIKLLQLDGMLSKDDGLKLESLTQKLAHFTEYVRFVESCCRDACGMAMQWTEEQCKQWTIELESGGNIKFTPGEPSLSWCKSCSDLVYSRFSVNSSLKLGANAITGIEVKSITRVENRVLYNRFNDKLKVLIEEEPTISLIQTPFSTMSSSHLFDYLFLVWNPEQDLVDLCKDGFPSDGLTSLSNSVNVADTPRLKEVTGQHSRVPALKFAELVNGKLLLCKVFIGKSIEIKDSQVPLATQENGVYYLKSEAPLSSSESQARQWFVSDGDLVLPEYIIHFSYLSELSSKDTFDIMMLEPPSLPDNGKHEFNQPFVSQPRLAMLDAPTVLRLTCQDNLSSVRELVLHDHRLTRFRLSSSLPQLHKLVLSSNELTNAEDFSNMPNLQVLDLSFNKLTCLQGMKSLPSLLELDISWNNLKSYHNDIAVLRRQCPVISSLDARHNSWKKAREFRMHVLGQLMTLSHLDGTKVTTEEASQAAQLVTASQLPLTSLLERACSSSTVAPSLSLLPLAEQLHCSIRKQPQPPMSTKEWTSKVTSVSLCGVGLRKLPCLDHLSNLKWLSLSDNSLSTFKGLTLCSKLEELTIDRNLLESIVGVECLSCLKWLSLSSNCLMSLPPLHTLAQLTYLNVSDNSLSSLTSLKGLSSLVELYASCNELTDIRQIFCLKSLMSLMVVDLSYNPISFSDNYRPFSLYHLSFIRALDGQPVEAGELASAREKFGGRLTQDLISEKYPDVYFSSLSTLDLVQYGLKSVDLSPVEELDNLASLNLEHNSLSSFSGLLYLNKLKVLCLNHNRIECMHHSRSPALRGDQVLKSLEVLHLAYNGIVNLLPLQLGRISSLKALFLQGNEITTVEGLEGLESLTELVLDRNKIKSLQESSFMSQIKLRELHLEENRLKELIHMSVPLPSLERLYLGMNRLQEFSELEKLSGLTELMELSIVSNPVSRRLQHRSLLIFHIPSLLSLDGVMVTSEEKHVAQMMFGSDSEAQRLDDISGELGMSAAGMQHSVGHSTTPLKVLTVPFAQFGHSQRKHMHSGAPYYHQLRKGRRT